MIQQTLFYIFATAVITSSIFVILLRNPVQCALCLVFSFIASAGLWLLAGAEFLALVLILVYVGAVMTLFLFVIMMLSTNRVLLKTQLWKYFLVALVLIGVLAYCMHLAIENTLMVDKVIQGLHSMDNIKSIGLVLYTEYGYLFVIAGLLLLVAIVASVTLVHRPPRNAKAQNIRAQIQVESTSRVRLVDVKRGEG